MFAMYKIYAAVGHPLLDKGWRYFEATIKLLCIEKIF